jgi:RNA polymerase sigma-70 factor (ECF subfamily)
MSAGPVEFPATRWSLVLHARRDTAGSREALETLLRAYWPPLLAFLIADGQTPDDARDLVQGFLARLLERNDLERVAPENGRFRSYLLAGLRHHLVSETRRARAAKRGAGALVSLEQDEAVAHLATLPAPGVSPETAYDRQWARLILERALARLRQEHAAQGKQALYEALAPALAGNEAAGHASLAARLGMSPGAVAVALHRLRRRLRELVRYEVLQTVGSAADLEGEMRHLLTVWGD